MNTGGLASEKTLLDEFAGQALPWCLGEFAGNPEDGTQYAEAAYQIASAMLAEKARREATDKDSLTVQTRKFDDDRWAKFQDGIIITFEPTMGWCASIREGSLGSGNTIAEAVANLRARWEERSAAPVVQQSSTTESYITDKNGIPVARVTHAPISDHSPDATKMIELEAANRELVEALESFKHADGCYCEAAFSGPNGTQPRHSPECEKARAILAKHKGNE